LIDWLVGWLLCAIISHLALVGWFSHALPPGYVLKSEKKEEVANDVSIEELIEEQV
jgi:hypothetical protein